MYELACPSCNSASQYDFNDFLLMCPFCSTTFHVDMHSGQKETFGEHYIIPNTSSPGQVKGLVLEWLKRLHHRPTQTEKEYFVVDINGLSIPFWIISMEAHTSWKGLVRRASRSRLEVNPGADFLIEEGQFRRNYRWAISSRTNICEFWGMTRLHEPKEDLSVEWDGFPLDSTFSRGQIDATRQISEAGAYEAREFFEFKFSNGLPILGVQISDEEALRRAKMHAEQYHLNLAKLNVDYLIDYRSEIEVAGIQLIHLPFWHCRYVYRPRSFLKHFYRPKEKNVVIEGFTNGVLRGELPLHHSDKVWVNSIVTAAATLLFLILGLGWHSAFYLVAAFSAIVSLGSAYTAMTKRSEAQKEEEDFGGKEANPEAA